MKTKFEMTYFDNEKNRSKTKFLSPLEIMFDDEDNKLPEEWYSYWTNENGIKVGIKIRVTLEVI